MIMTIAKAHKIITKFNKITMRKVNLTIKRTLIKKSNITQKEKRIVI